MFSLKKNLVLVLLVMVGIKSEGQNYPVKIFIPQYNTYFELSDNYKIGDTLVWKVTREKKLRFVFFDSMGSSYSEAYKGIALIEKGYYVNSLDTLRTYSSPVKRGKKRGPVSILKYFEPLKNGDWLEMRSGKMTKVVYLKGEEL
jgi:hypothetical protein